MSLLTKKIVIPVFFYECELDPLGYNVFFLQEIHGSLDIERLSLAWKRIVRDFLYYHLYVSKEQGKILLASFDNRSSSIEYIDQALSFDEIKSLIRKPFDLTNKSSLTRLCVIKKGIDKYCILFVCHHLISGGMIIYEFVRLLSNYYNDIYFRYSISIKTQQQENLLFVRKVKGMLETHREILMNFWREKLEGGESISLDFLKLPQGTYKYNKENKIFRYYSVPLEYVMGVARLAKQRVVTDYIIYITTLSVLFYKHLYEAPSKLLFSLPYLVNSKAYIQGVNNIFIPFCITRTKSFLCLLEDTKGFFMVSYPYLFYVSALCSHYNDSYIKFAPHFCWLRCSPFFVTLYYLIAVLIRYFLLFSCFYLLNNQCVQQTKKKI